MELVNYFMFVILPRIESHIHEIYNFCDGEYSVRFLP